MDSTIPPRLVPRDRIQGPRQRSTQKVRNIPRRSHGIREGSHEGLSVIYPDVGLRSNPNRNRQSGQGFSHSITSDCLSRLEDPEENLSEEVIRDVSGIMFTGEPFSSPAPVFLMVGHRRS